MKKYFIGIDFSKKKFDAVLLAHENLNAVGEHSTFNNSENGLHRLLDWAAKQTGNANKNGILFCGEHTGVYSRLISNGLAADGYDIWLESGLQIKRSLGLRRGKDDHQDARDIAEYCARNHDKARLYKPADTQMEALKFLFTHHKMLVQDKGNLQRRIGELRYAMKGNPYLKESLKSYDGLITHFDNDIKKNIQKMKDIIKCDAALERTYTILTSMKGIGPINAVAIIVVTDNFKKFDFDARKLASYWGVAPFARKSGSSIDGKPHVSHYADLYLKSLLSEAVMCAKRFCPAINDYYLRLKAKGKHPSIIMNNCKNKMLHILVAMVKNGTYYGEDRRNSI